MFDDRADAARQLAARLAHYRGTHPLVLGIPRGAVPMADIVAEALDGDLDVVLVRKLRAPDNPEFAIGAVEESGWYFVTQYAGAAGADPTYIEHERARQLETIRVRRATYTRHRPRLDPAGRNVIVVDDGLATGSTMLAALHAVRAQGAARVVCAVPVAPADTLAQVSKRADETVCLEVPEHFGAVGQFYRHFDQVEDDEVVRVLSARSVAAFLRPI